MSLTASNFFEKCGFRWTNAALHSRSIEMFNILSFTSELLVFTLTVCVVEAFEAVGPAGGVLAAGAKLLAVGFNDVGKTVGIVGCVGKEGGFLDPGLGGFMLTAGGCLPAVSGGLVGRGRFLEGGGGVFCNVVRSFFRAPGGRNSDSVRFF